MSKQQIKEVFKKVVESGGKLPMYTAMKEVGYAESTAVTPSQITNSRTWKQLLQEHLPDDLLTRKHKEGLDATVKKPHMIARDAKGNPIYRYVREEDYSTRHKYLETAYKIKDKFPKQAPAIFATQINFNQDKQEYA